MALRTCIVSCYDSDFQQSVQVVAETLHEAVVLAIKAMKVERGMIHMKSFDVIIKQPEVHHKVSGAVLNAWLAQNGKSPKEQALKERLKTLMRDEKAAESHMVLEERIRSENR